MLKNIINEHHILFFWNGIIIYNQLQVGCLDQTTNANCDLNSFEQTPNLSGLVRELMTKEMLIFKHYQMDSKDMKWPLKWWAKHETMFPIVVFLAC
jgi:hypothetical protein